MDEKPNPHAGKGGVVPPEATRWKKGQPSPNPGGMPKGSFSIRRALKIALAKKANEDGIGEKAAAIAERVIHAALTMDLEDAVPYVKEAIAQADGKLEAGKTDKKGRTKKIIHEHRMGVSDPSSKDTEGE